MRIETLMPIPSDDTKPQSRVQIRRRIGQSTISALVAIALMGSLYGCGASGLLKSNLDEYNDNTSLDELPGSSIPGSPDGDRVVNVVPVVVVTSGGTSLMEGHKLRVNGRVDYRTKEHSVPDRYQVVWSGLRDNHSSARTHIRLQDASGRNAIVLRLEGNSLILRSENEELNPQPTFDLDRVHAVSIIIEMRGAKSVMVEVTEGDDDTLFDTSQLGLFNADFSKLHTVQIESTTSANYFLQDLIVIAN